MRQQVRTRMRHYSKHRSNTSKINQPSTRAERRKEQREQAMLERKARIAERMAQNPALKRFSF